MADFIPAPPAGFLLDAATLAGDVSPIYIPQVAPGQKNTQIAYENNNPGNITDTSGAFKKYATPEEGYQDLRYRYIPEHAKRGLTLGQYISQYAPPDKNDTEAYMKNAEKALGTDRTTPLSKVDHDKLAQFQIHQESSASIIPPPPEGFSLDGNVPPPPEGFTLDAGSADEYKPSRFTGTEAGIPGMPKAPVPGALQGRPQPSLIERVWPLPETPHYKEFEQIGSPEGWYQGTATPPVPASGELIPQKPSAITLLKQLPNVVGAATRIAAETPIVPLTKLSPEAAAQLGDIAVPGMGAVARSVVERSPIARGAVQGLQQFGESMTTPASIGAIVGTEGLGLIPKIGALLPRAISGVFTYQMLKSAYDNIPKVREAIDKGDNQAAAKAITDVGLNTLLGLVGAAHAATDVTGRFARSLEQHNAAAEQAVAEEAQRPTPVGGEGTPVAGTNRPMNVRATEMAPDGTISKFDVVDPDTGEVLHQGDGQSVQSFISQYATQALNAAAERGRQAPPSAPEPSPAPTGIREGSTYDLPSGRFTVTNRTGDRVTFEQERADGSKMTKTMPLATFQKMVSRQPGTAPAPITPGKEAISSSAEAAAGAPQEVPSVRSEPEGGRVGETEGGPGVPGQPPVAPEPAPVVGGVPEPGRGAVGGGQPQPNAGSKGEPVRRVTGSANVPPTVAGEQQGEDLAKKATEPFDYVIAGDSDRHMAMAKHFAPEDAIAQSPAFDGWARGGLEGQQDKAVKPVMADLIQNWDKRPEGNSPVSGEPGATYKEFLHPLLSEVNDTVKNLAPTERALIVTSGGNLQAIDEWAKQGSPQNINDFDRSNLVKQPYWSATGKLFLLTPKGLKEVQDNKAPGLYFAEHGQTAYNAKANADTTPVSPQTGQPIAPTQVSGGPVSPAEGPVSPKIQTGQIEGIKTTSGTGREMLGSIPLSARREVAKPMLDIRRNPTGWLSLELPDGTALIHPSDDQVLRFEAQDPRRGTDVIRARAHAQAYAIDNPVAPAPAPTLPGELVVKPLFPKAEQKTPERSYSSTQVNLPEEFADKARAAAAKIPDSELAEDGRETEPHITLKYGLHGNDAAEVQKVLKGEGPITAKVGTMSIFPAKETSTQRGGPQYDVVKLDIDSPDLKRLNKKVADALPHTDTHPVYKPHITLAYVKAGEGSKYAGRPVPGLSGKTITFNAVTFSPAEGEKTEIALKPISDRIAPVSSEKPDALAKTMRGQRLYHSTGKSGSVDFDKFAGATWVTPSREYAEGVGGGGGRILEPKFTGTKVVDLSGQYSGPEAHAAMRKAFPDVTEQEINSIVDADQFPLPTKEYPTRRNYLPEMVWETNEEVSNAKLAEVAKRNGIDAIRFKETVGYSDKPHVVYLVTDPKHLTLVKSELQPESAAPKPANAPAEAKPITLEASAADLEAELDRLRKENQKLKGKPVQAGQKPTPVAPEATETIPALSQPPRRVSERAKEKPAERVATEAPSKVAQTGQSSEVPGKGVESTRGEEQPERGREGVLEPRKPSTPARYGESTRVLIPGENRGFDSRYAIRELGDVIPSHNPFTLQPNPDFQFRNDRNYSDQRNAERIVSQTANFDPTFVVADAPTASDGAPIIDRNGNVLGGNSRAMTIARVYRQRPDKAKEYRDLLTKKGSQFGLSEADIAAMSQPVLVRELDRELGTDETQAAITDLNKTGTAALSASERAIADSNRVSPETLEQLAGMIEAQGPSGTIAAALDGKGGSFIVDRLIKDGVITTQEKPTLFDNRGTLTAPAKDRISKLMLGRVFEDSAQFESAPPSLRNKLERIVAPLSRLSGKANWDLLPDVRAAVQMIEEARATGIKNLDDLVSQQGLFEGSQERSPRVVALAKAISSNGPVALAKMFNRYANDSKGPTMFGEVSPEDAFHDAFEYGAGSGKTEEVQPGQDDAQKQAEQNAVNRLGERGSVSGKNPYERKARLEKAVAMANMLDSIKVTPERAAQMTDEQWAMLAEGSLQKWDPKSDHAETKKAVIDHLKDIQRIRKFGSERGAIPINVPNVGRAMTALGEPAARKAMVQGARGEVTQALQDAVAGQSDKDFGKKIRTFVVGARDMRIAETNQLRDQLRRLVPNPQDQEALTLMRDFKNRPGELQQFRNGSHPAFAEIQDPQAQAEAIARVQKLDPIIEKALNPTPEMQQADAELTQYFTDHLKEGKQLGFLNSDIGNEEYITHILQPAERNGMAQRIGALMRGKLGPKRFKYAKQRYYPTMLHAIAGGAMPKTLNALDALGVYGDRFAATAAYRILVRTLRQTAAGKWGSYTDQQKGRIPSDWVELAPESRIFRHAVAYLRNEGEPALAYQTLFVPPELERAMRPILDPDYTSRIPLFEKTLAYQTYLKMVELGLSVFHLRALNVTALGNQGLTSSIANYMADMESPEFQDAEKFWVRAGMTTPVLGHTIEVYNALRPSSIPTLGEKIRGLPVIKQADKLAGAISHLTFGIVQRKLKVVDASLKYAAWLADNPQSTPQEQFTAARSIARQINATYGGLNWEALGVNRTTRNLARAILLAPDWTFSNVLNLGQAFEGGPGGKAARLFWLRSLLWGVALTAAMSYFLTGKRSKDPTRVLLGKEKNGRDLDDNIFFVGAPGDASTLVHDVARYGPFVGLAKAIANKLGPIGRTAEHLATNTTPQGGELIPRKTKENAFGRPVPAHTPTFGEKTALGAKEVAREMFPIPFSVSTIASMLHDPKYHYRLGQYVEAALTGRRPVAANQ